MPYHELSIEERIQTQLGQLKGLSQRVIARMFYRRPSTISRELRRNAVSVSKYSANQAQRQMRLRRTVCRTVRKLVPDGELLKLVV